MSHSTWRNLITEEIEKRGDSWDSVVSVAPANLDLDREFYAGFGGHQGEPFTLWTAGRVYFPVVYDGAEWVGSAPRNPNGEATEHQGGE